MNKYLEQIEEKQETLAKRLEIILKLLCVLNGMVWMLLIVILPAFFIDTYVLSESIKTFFKVIANLILVCTFGLVLVILTLAGKYIGESDEIFKEGLLAKDKRQPTSSRRIKR